MNFKRFHESKNLLEDVITEANIAPNGSITITPDYNIWVAKVTAGETYRANNVNGTYGFYTEKPTISSITYNNSRELFSGDSPTILVPQGISYIGIRATVAATNVMLNIGSEALPYEPYSSEVWHDTPHYIHNTSTDTITTPADIYPNDTAATFGLKGNMSQSSTPTPTNPIQPQECGDLETSGAKAGQYKIPILSNSTTTPVYLGEVESTRRIKKLVFTGEEGWNLYEGSTSRIGCMLKITDMKSTISTGRCTHFSPQYSPSSSQINGITFGTGNNYLYITFSSETAQELQLSNITSIKRWFAEQYDNDTPVTVWYIFATPTTGIVNEPLRKIGGYVDEVSGITIPTIAGANTLSVDTTVQPSEVSVNYKGWHPVQSVHEAENGQWD